MSNNSPSFKIFCVVVILSFTLTHQYEYNHTKFAVDLFYSVEKQNHEKSVIISPLSTEFVIGMLCMGAQGATNIETKKVVAPPKYYNRLLKRINQIPGVTIANKLYIHENFSVKDTYKLNLEQMFYSSIEAVDFLCAEEAADSINEWVKTQTKNLIPQLVQPDTFTEDTNLFLVNTITFSGEWKYPFDVAKTQMADFYVDEYKSVKVPMMFLSESLCGRRHKDLRADSVILPYAKGGLSFVIFVPFTHADFYNLENKIKELPIFDTDNIEEDTELFLPRFKVEFEYDLKDTMKNIGLRKLFSDSPDLSEILKSNDSPLSISKFIHKAVINVDEKGSTAAAASGAKTSNKIGGGPIRANKPFIYFITDNSRNVLFSGSYKGLKN